MISMAFASGRSANARLLAGPRSYNERTGHRAGRPVWHLGWGGYNRLVAGCPHRFGGFTGSKSTEMTSWLFSLHSIATLKLFTNRIQPWRDSIPSIIMISSLDSMPRKQEDLPGTRHLSQAVHVLRRLPETCGHRQGLQHAPGILHQFTLSENTDVCKELLTLHPAELREANPKHSLCL